MGAPAMRATVLWLGLASLCVTQIPTGVAFAQPMTIDQAVLAYNRREFIKAATLFFAAKDKADNPRAEYYLGRSLFRAGYMFPAYQFYGEIVKEGERHRFFLDAVRGLLDVAEAVGDDTLIPELINRKYGRKFSELKPEPLDHVHYLIGMISRRRGNARDAKQFLDAVSAASPHYNKARYLLAIMAVTAAARDRQSPDYSGAIRLFNDLERRLETATDEFDKKLYRLALLGQARAYYSQGDFTKSAEYYEKVPRFSDDWYDAVFESGWAYFRDAKFGRALGQVHSIHSPYFDGRYRSESFVLKATAYFQLCHFDRTRVALKSFFNVYGPIAERLKPWIAAGASDAQLVALMMDGDPKFPEELRQSIVSNRRFKKFLDQVREVDVERARARQELQPGNFKRQILALLEVQREQRVALTGRLVGAQLRRQARTLEDLIRQAEVIELETTSAERKMLEAGKDITKGPRAKGPRPIVPDASYQYWAFQGEYWIDELGYYEHSIKDECVPEVFE